MTVDRTSSPAPSAGKRPGFVAAGVAAWLLVGCAHSAPADGSVAVQAPPALLSETGLYDAGPDGPVRSDILAFSVQYPLWTDGATKRRWVRLPPGTWVDASDPESWRFPTGTRFWKEFSFGGRRVETRLMVAEPEGRWRYVAYQWLPDGSDAVRVPFVGVPAGVEVAGGGPRHVIPGETDCRSCHEGRPGEVLGFSLLQLSPDRDPHALHAPAPLVGEADLDTLIARGLVRGLPDDPASWPPRIQARTPLERAALGYLHGNCGGCHNPDGPLAGLGLVLSWSAAGADQVPPSIVGRASRFRTASRPDVTQRVAAADPEASMLALRLRSPDPWMRMPPLGSALVDDQAVALIEAWIAGSLVH